METTTQTRAVTTALQPYVYFYGRCEEAMQFYKKALEGDYEIMYVRNSPMAAQFPPDAADRVMHASFTAPGIAFLASDGRDVKPIDPDAGNIVLALSYADGAQGERVFAALSDGGKVTWPIDKAFWGGRYGGLIDRFGNEWIMTLP